MKDIDEKGYIKLKRIIAQKTHISESEVDELVNQKKKKLLWLNEVACAHIIAKELNINLYNSAKKVSE